MRAALFATLIGLSACAPAPKTFDYWQSYVETAEATGLLRRDRDPPDAPYDATTLIDNFARVALLPEADPFNTGAPIEQISMIRKWRQPIRYVLLAEPADAVRIEGKLDRFTSRLGQITGHPLDAFPEEPGPDDQANLYILFASEADFTELRNPANDDLTGTSRDARQFLREIARLVDQWQDAPSPCAGTIYASEQAGDPARGEILLAIVVIRTEMPQSMIDTCIEEELAQTMGTMNDDPAVRPSVFNDDDEFAVLTDHDAALLRLLYDKRLRPGMGPEEAMPIVRRIAREYWPRG